MSAASPAAGKKDPRGVGTDQGQDQVAVVGVGERDAHVHVKDVRGAGDRETRGDRRVVRDRLRDVRRAVGAARRPLRAHAHRESAGP